MPSLTTSRLILEHAYENVQDEIITWLNDANLMRYSEQRHRHHNVATQREYLRQFDSKTAFYWYIFTLDDEALVGAINAFIDVNNRVADMGILIGAKQGKGFGTEAWGRVMQWIFDQGLARKVEAGMMGSNKAMLRVCEKTHMAWEGRRTGHFLWGGSAVDLWQYGKFADGYQVAQGTVNFGGREVAGASGRGAGW